MEQNLLVYSFESKQKIYIFKKIDINVMSNEG